MTSAEAKLRKHRCGNCFDCPSCGHTLSTRGTFALAPTPGGTPGGSSSTPQKTYYLLCAFCRWSTRDGGIPDQNSPSGGWHETPNPHAEEIEKLVAAYRQLAVKEKNERERSKYVRKRNYTLLMEKYPVLTPRFRRCRSSNWSLYGRETEPSPEIVIPKATAKPISGSFDVDALVNTPLNFEKVTSPKQRHMAPSLQPTEAAKLEPRHKALAMKRSLRCKTCEHTLSKADFNPSSIKFRINLSAFCYVPDLRFTLPLENLEGGVSDSRGVTPRLLPTVSFDSVPPRELWLKGLSQAKPMNVVLFLSNPAHRITTVRLRQLTPEEEAVQLADYFAKTRSANSKEPASYSTVKLGLPPYGIKVGGKSDTSEYSDLASVDKSNEFFDDDPKVIACRRGNKVGINTTVSLLIPSGPLRAAVMMTFDYANTAAAVTGPSAALISAEQRAATMSAVLAASGISDNGGGGGSGSAPPPAKAEAVDTRDVHLVYLLDFGLC
ncbi:unnamed protein product [Mesocestoides corti]|uniref:Dynactin subunit 4 n=2 Tax=Mesocestoides corti TaxID=53468 RepID=A0A0R3U8P3_MESCO|nr:unnamed protein product [Mesocestoides corti]